MMKSKLLDIGIVLLLCTSLLVSCLSSSQQEVSQPTVESSASPELKTFPTFSPSAVITEAPIATQSLEIPNELTPCFATESPRGTFGCVVTTIAGSDDFGIGDGGDPRHAVLNGPTKVDIGLHGEIYISDTFDDRIRVVSDGKIQTLIGIGPAVAQGPIDGMPAAETLTRRPAGIAVSPDGLLYFAENKFHDVRRINQNGIVETVAGGKSPLSPLGDGASALNAALLHPADVIFDQDGNLYIANSTRHRIRMIDRNGIIHSVAGNGQLGDSGDHGLAINATLSNPESLAFDSKGRLFIGGGGRIRIVDLETGIITGIENTAGASHIVIDSQDRLFASFPGFHIVAEIMPDGSRTIIAGTGVPGFGGDDAPGSEAMLSYPLGLAVDNAGNLYIADRDNRRIRRVLPSGAIETFAGNGQTVPDGLPAEQSPIYGSDGMVFDLYGNLLFSDYDHALVRRLGIDGIITTVAGNGQPVYAGDGGHPLSASINDPRALVLDSKGNLLFADHSSDSEVIRRITPGADGVINGGSDEVIQTVAGVPGGSQTHTVPPRVENIKGQEAIFWDIFGLTFDSKGNLYLADWTYHQIYRLTPGADGIINGKEDEIINVFAGDGQSILNIENKKAKDASIPYPYWLVTDSQDNLYVNSSEINSKPLILKIDAQTGVVTELVTVRGPATFVIDSHNYLYFTDTSQIWRVNTQTKETVLIAGVGTGGWTGLEGGFSGDGGDARSAEFRGVFVPAIDGMGNIYVSDPGNGRLRKIWFVPLEPNSAPHPVNIEAPLPTSSIPLPVEITPASEPLNLPSEIHAWQIDNGACVEDTESVKLPRLQCMGRVTRDDGPENPEYAFYAEGFNPILFPTNQWAMESNCALRGWGGYGPVITVEVAGPPTTCSISLTLPNGVSGSTEVNHDP